MTPAELVTVHFGVILRERSDRRILETLRFAQGDRGSGGTFSGIVVGGEIVSKIEKQDIEEIRKVIEEEFPNDPALQHVHIARKIIAQEAGLEGLRFLEYNKSPGKQIEDAE